MSYQLNVLGIALTYGGSILLEYKDLLVRVIAAAFDAPSIKVVHLLIASFPGCFSEKKLVRP